MITIAAANRPDVCYFSAKKAKQFSEDQGLFPAPDLVVEVLSESTKGNDRGVKFKDYEAHGITEYWIVDAEKEVIEQYCLQDGQYDLMLKAGQGALKSFTVVGFEIPVRAIFDKQENVNALQQIIK